MVGASGIIGQLVPQPATSIAADNYYFGTQAVYIDPGRIYAASTGVATINSIGVLTGSEDSNEAQAANVPQDAGAAYHSGWRLTFARLKLHREAATCMLAAESRSQSKNRYSNFAFFERNTYQEAGNEKT